MAHAEFHEVIEADKDKLYAVITQYEAYPKFVDGCKSAEVTRTPEGRTLVKYKVSMMKDVEYTLEHAENLSAGIVSWTMVSSDSFKKNNGRWELKDVGSGKTDVKYQLELEFNFPVPSLILNRLVKGSLPSMVKSFVKQSKKV